MMPSDLTILIAVGLSLLGGLLGVFVGMFRWLSGRLLGDIDLRLQKIEALEGKVATLYTDLPILYQRREDAIREHATILARIDALGRSWEQAVHREDYVRDVSIMHAKLDALVGRIDRAIESRRTEP